MGYQTNRERVYQIYGVDINDHSYNCHHIVTREDVKKGLVSPDFDLHSVANLIPLKIRDHERIHQYFQSLERQPKEIHPQRPDKDARAKLYELYLEQKNNLKKKSIQKIEKQNPITITVVDHRFFDFLKQRKVQEKSTSGKFLVWKRQGVL